MLFENLTPLFRAERLHLERGNGSTEDLTPRIIDLIAPIGKGQRALVVSPPKAGKTMMLQSVAHSIMSNHEECYLIVLLIDERARGGHGDGPLGARRGRLQHVRRAREPSTCRLRRW